MKKFITMLCLGTALAGAFKPQKAEAGVFILATAGTVAVITEMRDGEVSEAAGYMAVTGLSVGALGSTAALVMMTANILDQSRAGQLANLFLLLDADGSLPKTDLENVLGNKFPFIDEQLALENISSAVAAKYDAVKFQQPDAYITLTKQEVDQAVRHLPLTKSERAALYSELTK